jgi:hypothetical protein
LFSSSRGTRSGGSLLRSRNNVTATNTFTEGEDDNEDLFSELYSENPAPIDPNGSPGPGESQLNEDSPSRIRGDTNSDISTPTSHDDQLYGSAGGHSPMRTPSRSQQGPRSSERRSGVFRLFRRRSRSNRNLPRSDDSS